MIFLLFRYGFVMVLGLNQTRYILIFLVLEWLSWIFSITLTVLSIKYLLIQRYFSLVFLIIIFMVPELIISRLLLKMGFPPFYNWAITLFKFFRKRNFLFVITLHKVLPTIFSGKCFSIYFRLLSIVILCALFLQATNLFLVLIFSSFLHGWWLIIARYFYQKLFWQYWMVYGRVLSLFLMSIAFSKLRLFSNGQTTLRGISFLVLSGFPPFLLFWIKASLFIILIKRRVYLALILIFSSVVRLFVYFRVFCLRLRLRDKNNRKFIPVLIISLLVGFFY